MNLSNPLQRGPQPLASILQITPYQGGEAPQSGHKLSSNENPLGCSPLVAQALARAGETLAAYPDGHSTALREAIGQAYGIDPARIVCGAGSDEIFQFLARAYLSPGDEIIQTTHGFLVYRLVAQASGAITINAPETQLTGDVDAILASLSARTKIVFLANPNNPTGTYIPFQEVRRLQAGLPENVLLVLDGAYAEYVQQNDYSAGLELAGEMANVLMTRTFSKVHGLAALRLGWAFGPASVIDAINRVRGPFNVSSLAQAAGIAAISDSGFVARSVAHNSTERQRLERALAGPGRELVASVANFILIRFADGPQIAARVDQFLRERGLFLRAVGSYGLADCLRLSVGTAEANTAVIEAFAEFDAGKAA